MSELPREACRLRVRYAKEGRLAHLGHLEVTGTIMRSIRRAGLPFEVGNGFARRMRIQFSQALPVGAASLAEYFDLMIASPIDAAKALEELRASSPSLLSPRQAGLVARRVPALEAWANRSLWDVRIDCSAEEAESFPHNVQAVVDRGSLDFMRGDKPRHLEIGPLLVSCEVQPATHGLRLLLDTRSTEQGSLRPAVFVQCVMGRSPAHVCRLGQWHEAEDGSLVDPLDCGTAQI